MIGDHENPDIHERENRHPEREALFAALREISGLTKVQEMLQQVLASAISLSGADRAFLLRSKVNGLTIKVEGDHDPASVEVPPQADRIKTAGLSEAVLDFVKENLLPTVVEDPQNKKPTILCLPLVEGTHLQGMIYLEKKSGSFGEEEFEHLEALARHAGISIGVAIQFESMRKTLVESEKLASLGQVTAGIAHEIRNPLNFVRNFSELSIELAAELREKLIERKGADQEDEFLNELQEYLDDLEHNAGKVRHHGERAESIVESMLLHAAAGKGEKLAVNLNKLAKEYVYLAYHGIRGRHSAFGCTIDLDFQEDLVPVKIIQQDISRALLNIFQNAFQALEDKLIAEPEFRPELKVRSRDLGEKVELLIRDNGPGIPEEVRLKIFEPFFTTKPSGKGTGLGLSLARDLIVKGHKGSLEVKSAPGEFTEFLIRLPKNVEEKA